MTSARSICSLLPLKMPSVGFCDLHAVVSLEHISASIMEAHNLLDFIFAQMFISWDAYLACKTPHTPPALCMWLEHRPQCSTWSNRQMGVSHSVAMMERNYHAEYCPPSHTTSNSLDVQYSPNHSIFLFMIVLSIGQDSLVHWNSKMSIDKWVRNWMTKLFWEQYWIYMWFKTFPGLSTACRRVNVQIKILKRQLWSTFQTFSVAEMFSRSLCLIVKKDNNYVAAGLRTRSKACWWSSLSHRLFYRLWLTSWLNSIP